MYFLHESLYCHHLEKATDAIAKRPYASGTEYADALIHALQTDTELGKRLLANKTILSE